MRKQEEIKKVCSQQKSILGFFYLNLITLFVFYGQSSQFL